MTAFLVLTGTLAYPLMALPILATATTCSSPP